MILSCSEEEAKKKIYSVCTSTYTGFGALISEELSYKVKGGINIGLILAKVLLHHEVLTELFLLCCLHSLKDCLEFFGCYLIRIWMFLTRITEVGNYCFLLH